MNNQTSCLTSWSTANLVTNGLMGLFFLIGVPGNIAVIIAIVRHFKKNNFTVHLMLNLAVADILCLLTVPGWIYSQQCSISTPTCKFFKGLAFCSAYSGLITVTALSVYRCLRIWHPQMCPKMDKRKERVFLLTCWILALVFSCPGVLTTNVIQVETKAECERILDSDVKLAFAALESLLGFVLPLTVILISYYYLHKKVNQGLLKHRQRLTILVTRIIIMFLICWAPHHIIKLVDILAQLSKSNLDLNYTADFVGCLTFINSCVNPFLYAFSSKNLRQQKQERQETRVVGIDSSSQL
ncbi:C-X-C chemokine receptor type 1-like [Paramisgurnus dabryanus]|uniref:C-X-C chemokine receptor type 1-like n=1 Tax=Paramisgurnus dabryanus TaxID=90735 RepID=UPI0031F3BA02